MRIAFFAPAPLDLLTGGYVYNRRMIDEWRAAGHDATIAGLTGTHPLADDAARESARAAWAAMPDDAVPVIDNLALPSFAPLAADLTTRRAVLLDHHPTGLEPGLNAEIASALIAIETQLLPRFRCVVTTSDTIAATVANDFGVARDRLHTIVPGTDDAPRSQGSGGKIVHVLSIGSLIPRKGHDILLRAMARLFDLDWRLTIAGTERLDPAYAAQIKALAGELGIAGKVTFLGETSGAPLAALWDSADIFALATRYEGFGMVIAEALKRGLPVVVGNGGAAGALIRPDYGAVCPVDDVEQTSRALRRIIFDTRLRQDMSDAAWSAGRDVPGWKTQADAFAALLA
ncbi:MAG: glycosyltransferase family 4 protein [Acetobacteraceae bacterium]|nr:glycosyltransferase family 4 protein [Acetobacteraceae bacterium]